MDFSIVPVSKVFKTYQGQTRIADLNKKSSIKRLQGQRDQVSISSTARQELKKKIIGDALQTIGKEEVPVNTIKQALEGSDDFIPGV
ncbi:MAG: hypothetical protein VX579_03450 [Nitrospinota bacterium]|nr:hypothetical protein [Nitrospinota bacterium]MEC9019454.1 hypothetical protein [Nitrospinota bacterium]MED5353082.1 hypothetical protein [Nitrospinota bacterium]